MSSNELASHFQNSTSGVTANKFNISNLIFIQFGEKKDNEEFEFLQEKLKFLSCFIKNWSKRSLGI